VAGLAVTVSTTLGAPPPSDIADSPGLSSNIPVTTSAPHSVPGGYQVSAAYTVSAPVSALEVYGGNTVTVTGSQRSTVSISEHVTWFGSGSRPAMVRNLTGNKVTLEYTCSGEPLCAVSYDIQVPRGLSVMVNSSSGDIRFSALAGSVDAMSGTGSITASGLSSREAGFVSNSGAISAVFTGNGKATVSVPQSFSSRHVIDANSNEGDVLIAPSP
jgi:hypothetical protein